MQMKKGEGGVERRKIIGTFKDVTRDKNAKVGKNGRERAGGEYRKIQKRC